MSKNIVYKDISQLAPKLPEFIDQTSRGPTSRFAGICGFDGFIDTFIRLQNPDSMAEFGPKVTAAAGISTSYPVMHLGDKFGGNGPLFASALHGIFAGKADITYIGALGKGSVLPIFQEAIGDKMKAIHTVAEPAHSDCLEFNDGKIMLSDLRSCADVTWDRLLECIGLEQIDVLLKESHFVAAVNWGKLINVGGIWENLAQRLASLGVPKKKVLFFMDLAEFEQRPTEDCLGLVELVGKITQQCHTMLSLNLKEAWQMGKLVGGDFHGKKSPEEVAELAAFLKSKIKADRIIIHPNNGAACASADGCVYVPGPFCRKPLISTGAGDNFGAGCLAAALIGLDNLGLLLTGVCTSGHFVRSGNSPDWDGIGRLATLWMNGKLPERLAE